MTRAKRGISSLLVPVIACALACTDADRSPAERGERVYLANCIACHHLDPTRDGTLGPALAGSSRALLEARVIHGTYPPGYSPKRDTDTMVPQPYLAKDMDDLAAYLDGP